MDNLEWLGADGAVDESRLAGTLEAFRPRLKRIVHLRLEPRLRARVDPSDIVQETFVEAIARAGGYAAKYRTHRLLSEYPKRLDRHSPSRCLTTVSTRQYIQFLVLRTPP